MPRESSREFRPGLPPELSPVHVEGFTSFLAELFGLVRQRKLDKRTAAALVLYVDGVLRLGSRVHQTSHVGEALDGSTATRVRMARVISNEWPAREMLAAHVASVIGDRPIRRMLLNCHVVDSVVSPEGDEPSEREGPLHTFVELQLELATETGAEWLTFGFRGLAPSSTQEPYEVGAALVEHAVTALGFRGAPGLRTSPPPVLCPDFFLGETLANQLATIRVESATMVPTMRAHHYYELDLARQQHRPYGTIADLLRFANGGPLRLRRRQGRALQSEWAVLCEHDSEECWLLRPVLEPQDGAFSPESLLRSRAHELAALVALPRPPVSSRRLGADLLRYAGDDGGLERHCALLALLDLYLAASGSPTA